MEAEDDKIMEQRHNWLACITKCLPISSSPPSKHNSEAKHDLTTVSPLSVETTRRRKPGGWKSMPYVLGNETFERLGSIGLLANFMIFLLTQFHMDQAHAANLLNTWSGVTNFVPLIGAFISDAYVGRFWTIAFGSFASLLGMVTLTLIAWIPKLHPPPCTQHPGPSDQCHGPTASQLGVLILALGFLSLGAGGIRPCSLPFGVDQFDSTTAEGRKGINSFFNWYYTSFTVVLILALTVVVYIQDSVSWVLGFGIPTSLMVASILLFFLGTKVYVYVEPEGSVFSGIAQSLVAAWKKRRVKLPEDDDDDGVVFYDPPLKTTLNTKLPLTNRFRFLNKAAIITRDNEVNPDGSPSHPWRLCSIQQVEELKCLLKVVPICASGVICFTAMSQQGTFTVSQALKMDRHLGPNFQIPPGSLGVISMLTIGLWLPLYDRALVPALRRATGHEGGITLLQRIGIGIVFSALSMVAAGSIEGMRRHVATSDGGRTISVLWLAPQLILMGFAEAFSIIGQIEFYYKEFPENMKSLANSLFFVTSGCANYLSSLLITVVHGLTGGDGRPDWLDKDINAGKVDYFYYLIAGMGVLNFGYFLYCAGGYEYKNNTGTVAMEDKGQLDVERNSTKE